MSSRASMIIWSTGAGILLGLFVDAMIVGIWMVMSTAVPSLSPRQLPRWASFTGAILLAIIPLAVGVLGYLEGRLKAA